MIRSSIRGVCMAGVMMLLGGCSGNASTDETTASPTTIAAAPTTTAHYSRQALEAIQRCTNHFGDLFAFKVSLESELGRTDALEEAKADCEEAKLQIEVDNDFRLRAPVSQIIGTLSFTILLIELPAYAGDYDKMILDETEQADLQARVDDFVQKAEDAISGVNFD